MSTVHPLIEYTNLLHKYQDPGCKTVREFVDKHKDDQVLMRRIKTLNMLWFGYSKEIFDGR